MSSSVLIILLSTLGFALIHSLLALNKVKQWVYTTGLTPASYRLTYVIIATVLTAVWLYIVASQPDTSLYQLQGSLLVIAYGFKVIAVVLFYLSIKVIDTPAFLGFKAFPNNSEPFLVAGIFRYIRHPMYSSLMLFMLTRPSQSINSASLFTCVTLYFIFGARLEENRLSAEHPDYQQYRQQVPAFIPRLSTILAMNRSVNK